MDSPAEVDNTSSGFISEALQRDLFEITDGSRDGPLRVYTNVMVLWDMLPKYDVWGGSKRYHEELTLTERVRIVPVRHRVHLDSMRDDEVYADLELHIEPATIEKKRIERIPSADGKGSRKKQVIRDEHGNPIFDRFLVYPGAREDKVEEALKFLLSHGQGDWQFRETWVKFSVRQLQRELKNTGNTFSLDEIKESLQVLSSSQCKIFSIDSATGKRKSVLASTFLPSLAMVDRDKYTARLKAGDETRCYAQFHALVTEGIRNNQFRLTNYLKHQRLDNLLSRFIHKIIRLGFVNASSQERSFPLKMNQTLSEFGRASSRSDKNVQVFKTALNELISAGIILRYEVVEIRDPNDRRQIHDRHFNCFPTEEFIAEMIKANSMNKRNRLTLKERRDKAGLAAHVKSLPESKKGLVRELTVIGMATQTALEEVLTHPPKVIRDVLKKVRAKSDDVDNMAGLVITMLRKAANEAKSLPQPVSTAADTEEFEISPDVFDALKPHQQQFILEHWESWTVGDRKTFNKHGLSNPYVRNVLMDGLVND